jgi:RHH-type transcriptional regulator, rel operon repressor / antitoxin RelB
MSEAIFFAMLKTMASGHPPTLLYADVYRTMRDMSEVTTIRVDRKTEARLEKLAKAMARTKSFVAAEAIRAYVDLNEWQIGEIKAALKEADAEDFASEEEVQAVMSKQRCGAG